MGLILQDATVSIRMGPKWDGTVPTFSGTAVSFMAKVKRLEVTSRVEKVDVRGAGSEVRLNRFFGKGDTMILEGVVPSSGFDFWPDTSTVPVKYWIEVTTKPLSSLSTSTVSTGVIEEWNWQASDGQPQMQRISIDLNADTT